MNIKYKFQKIELESSGNEDESAFLKMSDSKNGSNFKAKTFLSRQNVSPS